MSKFKTSLGIDIANGRVNMAMLKASEDVIELVKAVSCPVPEAAIKDGNIVDSTILSDAIKKLKVSNKINADNVSISLVGRPSLMHIMYMPKEVPGNIRQYFEDEVKNYSSLKGRKVALDFCRVSSTRQSSGERVFVAATDCRNVLELTKTSNAADLRLASVETGLTAFSRAFFSEKCAQKSDSEILLVLLQDGILTLCVFREQNIDFVRTKEVSREINGEEKFTDWLASEINAVIRFYDVEVAGSSGMWEVVLYINDSIILSESAKNGLSTKIEKTNLSLRMSEDIFTGPLFKLNDGSRMVSPVAVGLAMGLLAKPNDLKINLLPAEFGELKANRKDVLIKANLTGVAFLIMMAITFLIAFMSEKTSKAFSREQQEKLSQNTKALYEEQAKLDKLINAVAKKNVKIEKALTVFRDVQWGHILKDIKKNTPRTIRITDLTGVNDSKLSLKGLALTYDGVNLFVVMLAKSQYIKSVSLLETETDKADHGLIKYVINCDLVEKKGQ